MNSSIKIGSFLKAEIENFTYYIIEPYEAIKEANFLYFILTISSVSLAYTSRKEFLFFLNSLK